MVEQKAPRVNATQHILAVIDLAVTEHHFLETPVRDTGIHGSVPR